MWMKLLARNFTKWFTAKGYLIITLGVVIVAIVSGIGVFEGLETKTRAAVGQTLYAVLNSTERGLSEWTDARRADAQSLAHQAIVQEATRKLLSTSRTPQALRQHAAQAKIRDATESLLRSGTYLGVCITDVDGLVLASTRDQVIGATTKVASLWSERLAAVFAGHTVFAPPIWLESSPSNLTAPHSPLISTMFVLTPIEGESGKPIAVLVLKINLSDRFSEIVHAARFGNSLEVYAFDKTARLLTSTRFDEVLIGAGLLRASGQPSGAVVLREPPVELTSETVVKPDVEPWPMTRMATRAMQKTQGVDVRGYRGFLGHHVLGAWTWNEELELGLGVEIDETEALARLRDHRWLFFWVCGVFVTLLLGLTLAIRHGRKHLGRILRSVDAVTARRVRECTEELTKRNEGLLQKIEEHRVVESSLRVAQQSLEETSERFARLSQLDALTNLANRRRFDEFLEREWRRSTRYSKPISLVLVDIDYFRLFNDNYGHGAGDDCLREIAGVLIFAARRPDDLAARLGGEEFALVLCDTDAEGARAIAHHVRSAVENLAIDHEMTMVSDSDTVTVSVGVATKLPEPNSGPSVLLYHADEALFLAKQDGRNCVRTYEDYTTQSQATANPRASASSIWPQQSLGRKPQ